MLILFLFYEKYFTFLYFYYTFSGFRSFGSSTLCKENETLACPKARWLGIHPSELIALGAKTIPLNEADLVKLRSIAARSYVNETVSKQLSILRKGKAEIEAVSSISKNFLTATYLSYKINGQDYI